MDVITVITISSIIITISSSESKKNKSKGSILTWNTDGEWFLRRMILKQSNTATTQVATARSDTTLITTTAAKHINTQRLVADFSLVRYLENTSCVHKSCIKGFHSEYFITCIHSSIQQLFRKKPWIFSKFISEILSKWNLVPNIIFLLQ